MPQSVSCTVSIAVALWVCVAASVICIRTAEAACGCSSSQARIFMPKSSNNSSTGNNSSTSNDATTSGSVVPEARRSAIRIDDMLIPIEDFEMPMSAEGSSGGLRLSANPSEHINCVRPWPNGRLYYRFDNSYPTPERELIRESLANLELRTNNSISFIDIGNNTINVAHVNVINEDGCWSYVGKVYRSLPQELSLSVPGCMLESIVQHEFMHALGFSHEQARLDRDNYLQILWSNIDSDNCNNFEKRSYIIPSDFPSYDYGSVMHYTSDAFACINGLNTFVMLNGSTISERTNLSDYDVAKLKYMYSANNLEYCFSTAIPETKFSSRSVIGCCANVAICLLVICCCISLFN